MRQLFADRGFDFVDEFMRAYALHDSVRDPMRLEALTKMAPYFMQRLREEPEDVPVPPIDVTPEAESLSDEELLVIASGNSSTGSEEDPGPKDTLAKKKP